MKTIRYDHFQETVHQFKLHERLRGLMIEKPGYHKTYVTLSTPLGSIHQSYLDKQGKLIKVPAGVAHFLEHKVFEVDGEDISKEFSMKEAQINAYTEHGRTTYLFHATNHVIDHTARLINMFFYPKFTEEGIEKEKNIIKEELNMHLDDPYYQQYQALMHQLFVSHPVRDDILGTASSIEAMSLKDLTAMHQAYYHPEHCFLTIVGDLDAKSLVETLETLVVLPNQSIVSPRLVLSEEPMHVFQSHSTMDADILIPNVLIGIKHIPSSSDTMEIIKDQMSFSLFMELVFGKTSDYYETWLEKGFINDSYGVESSLESTFGYALIGSESLYPEEFLETLNEAFKQLPTFTIDKDDFERSKKQMLGSFVMSLDSLENLAHETSRWALEGQNVYTLLDLTRTLTLDDIEKQKHMIKETMLSSVIIKPKK